MKLRTEERGTETTAGSKLKEKDEGESKTKHGRSYQREEITKSKEGRNKGMREGKQGCMEGQNKKIKKRGMQGKNNRSKKKTTLTERGASREGEGKICKETRRRSGMSSRKAETNGKERKDKFKRSEENEME